MKKILFFILITTLINLFPQKTYGADSPKVSSVSAILIDIKTAEVLFEKKAGDRMYPASLTKIATAIYAIEKGNLNDNVTIGKNPRETEGTRVYLEEGETVTLRKLVQGLLINSGNDAGVAIAEHLDGSIEAFSNNLNEYLAKLGLKNTVFKNPHGLFDAEHVTTAEDLALLTRYAMENEEFKEVFGTRELKWKGASWDTTLYTHHKLMRESPYEGIIGGKTGFVDQSGHTLVTVANRKDLSLIVVTLNAASQDIAYEDTRKLLDFGFSHYKTSTIPKGVAFKVKDSIYTAKKILYFTQHIQEDAQNSITEDGSIEILKPSEKFLSDLQGEDFIQKTNEKKETIKESKEQNVKKGGKEVYLLGIVLLSAIAAFLVIKRKISPKIFNKKIL
ncbi:D-alanyl-D-alanine carboxypeptidase family protein [Cytobacillus firmus]|uniref:D-alanyl-D-alanine carboxypeptidase n=1 Tax=Cytobacillus firmus DS1 TaxID=1307436 RepID=W7L0N4_CYTFI|nr:D-alanyl-D-alanine carboxypeptidase family protein [Cytobacillus firmus]EWG08592.1 D-alanyl-D-alanine carboxypeptidase [Cytobacillus firmus DS1]